MCEHKERVAEDFAANPKPSCRKIQKALGISSASVVWFHLQRIKGNIKTKEQMANDCAALEARCTALEKGDRILRSIMANLPDKIVVGSNGSW